MIANIHNAYRALMLLVLTPLALAQELPKAALEGLEVQYVTAVAVDSQPGRSQQLEIAALPGDRLSLRLPFVPNRLQPLVADGAMVAAGDAVARISGPEVAHWLLEASMVVARFEDAERRYERNRALYQQQALDASTWFSISEQYRLLRVEEHHVRHALEWMDTATDDEDSALLRVPRGGVLLFADTTAGDGTLPVLSIIDSAALRLTGWIAAERQVRPAGLSTGNCALDIARVEARVTGFSRRVWSAPIGNCLPPSPGLRLSGQLLYAFAGYRVPRGAVFRIDGQSVIALDRGANLQIAEVEIAGEDGENYYVNSAENLRDVQVLSRSTSALQGLLMGLGGEG